MPPTGFKLTIPQSERLQPQALERAAAGISNKYLLGGSY